MPQAVSATIADPNPRSATLYATPRSPPIRPCHNQPSRNMTQRSVSLLPSADSIGYETLGARDVAAFEDTSLPFDAGPIAASAMACAHQEDALIFNGSKRIGCAGLLNADGAGKMKLRAWDKVGDAVDDVIKAVSSLDAEGFHGPYSLALSPKRYNLLFRRYPQGNLTEMQHLQQLVTDGVIKTAAIAGGGEGVSVQLMGRCCPRLLEHDFREPRGVGIATLMPRQVPPLMLAPARQLLLDGLDTLPAIHGHCRRYTGDT